MLVLVYSSIVLVECDKDGATEARAGRVLHLSRGALPAVLNIGGGVREGAGAQEGGAGRGGRNCFVDLALLYFCHYYTLWFANDLLRFGQGLAKVAASPRAGCGAFTNEARGE